METILCPGCAKKVGLPTDLLGQATRCPLCRTHFIVTRSEDGSTSIELIKRNPFTVSRAILPGWVMLLFSIVVFVLNGKLAMDAWGNPDQLRESMTNTFNEVAEQAKDPAILERLEPTIIWYPRIRAICAGLALISIAGGICMIRRRGHLLALAGAFSMMFNVIGSCCITLPIGGWAMLVLLNPNVKKQFDAILP